MALREEFPAAGSDYLGGESDGYEYRTVFAGSSLEATYEMVRQFLREEGYGDIPLPRNAGELKLFRLATRNKQILLFEDNGYVHNPIKVLFPLDRRKKTTLILCIYNEADPQHLLRFHRVMEPPYSMGEPGKSPSPTLPEGEKPHPAPPRGGGRGDLEL